MAIYTIDNQTAPVDFECNNDPVQRTIQNCKNLIMTRLGEVPYDRMRGINPVLFDLPIGEMNNNLLSEVERVLAWEPDATATEATATLDAAGETIITVKVEINL